MVSARQLQCLPTITSFLEYKKQTFSNYCQAILKNRYRCTKSQQLKKFHPIELISMIYNSMHLLSKKRQEIILIRLLSALFRVLTSPKLYRLSTIMNNIKDTQVSQGQKLHSQSQQTKRVISNRNLHHFISYLLMKTTLIIRNRESNKKINI